jgi:hypothetical protein
MLLDVQMHKVDTGAEPAPRFASDAEIELAERLRHKLEEQYFGPAAAPLPARGRPDNGC